MLAVRFKRQNYDVDDVVEGPTQIKTCQNCMVPYLQIVFTVVADWL